MVIPMGLVFDSSTPLPRRSALRMLLGASLLAALGCDAGSASPGSEASPNAAPGPAVPPTTDRSAPAIVFLGDSLTAGFGLSESEALPALIQRRVDDEHLPYHVINAGRSGDTTAGGLARIDWYFKSSLDLKVLVIGLGSNDAMRGLPLE